MVITAVTIATAHSNGDHLYRMRKISGWDMATESTSSKRPEDAPGAVLASMQKSCEALAARYKQQVQRLRVSAAKYTAVCAPGNTRVSNTQQQAREPDRTPCRGREGAHTARVAPARWSTTAQYVLREWCVARGCVGVWASVGVQVWRWPFGYFGCGGVIRRGWTSSSPGDIFDAISDSGTRYVRSQGVSNPWLS